jgi:hypothetical protein
MADIVCDMNPILYDIRARLSLNFPQECYQNSRLRSLGTTSSELWVKLKTTVFRMTRFPTMRTHRWAGGLGLKVSKGFTAVVLRSVAVGQVGTPLARLLFDRLGCSSPSFPKSHLRAVPTRATCGYPDLRLRHS